MDVRLRVGNRLACTLAGDLSPAGESGAGGALTLTILVVHFRISVMLTSDEADASVIVPAVVPVLVDVDRRLAAWCDLGACKPADRVMFIEACRNALCIRQRSASRVPSA